MNLQLRDIKCMVNRISEKISNKLKIALTIRKGIVNLFTNPQGLIVMGKS